MNKDSYVELDIGVLVFPEKKAKVGDEITGWQAHYSESKTISKMRDQVVRGIVVNDNPQPNWLMRSYTSFRSAILKSWLFEDNEELIKLFEIQNPFIWNNHRARRYLLEALRGEKTKKRPKVGRPKSFQVAMREREIAYVTAALLEIGLSSQNERGRGNHAIYKNVNAHILVGELYGASERTAREFYEKHKNKRLTKAMAIRSKKISSYFAERGEIEKDLKILGYTIKKDILNTYLKLRKSLNQSK